MRDGYAVMLISTGGTVIRMPVDDIKRLGRATQGVIVMRLRGDERVSSLAPVVESDDDAGTESDSTVEADREPSLEVAVEPGDEPTSTLTARRPPDEVGLGRFRPFPLLKLRKGVYISVWKGRRPSLTRDRHGLHRSG